MPRPWQHISLTLLLNAALSLSFLPNPCPSLPSPSLSVVPHLQFTHVGQVDEHLDDLVGVLHQLKHLQRTLIRNLIQSQTAGGAGKLAVRV